MFKKFTKSTKYLSLILALVMVFGFTSGVFAAGDQIIVDTNTPEDFEVSSIGATTSYKSVTIQHEDNSQWPDDTKYTAYLEFGQNSTINMDKIIIDTLYDTDEYDLTVAGVDYIDNMEVDFSNGYVNFVLTNKNGTEYKTYQVNAGIYGKDVNIGVSINVSNAQEWFNTASPTDKSYAKVKNALEGFQGSTYTTIVVPVGTTAMEATKEAARVLKLELDGADQGYIREINKIGYQGLREFDITTQSGWMYKMNDLMAPVGASQYVIDSSTKTMEWGFTLNYGQDLGGAPW